MERIANLRQSQPASSELDFAKYYLQTAQAVNTPAELAEALNIAASHRRRAISEYTDHVRAERVYAIRKAMFAAVPNAQQVDWIRLCAIPAAVLLRQPLDAESVRFSSAIRSQGATLRKFVKQEVA
jgi:L-lysine 2,3-aminomutase